MTDHIHSDTPTFDELNARYKTFPDLLLPEPVDKKTVEQSLAAQALPELRPRTPMSKKGYSLSAQDIIEVINNAILDGKRTVGNGQSFLNYAVERIPYITSHELTRFLEDIRRHS